MNTINPAIIEYIKIGDEYDALHNKIYGQSNTMTFKEQWENAKNIARSLNSEINLENKND